MLLVRHHLPHQLQRMVVEAGEVDSPEMKEVRYNLFDIHRCLVHSMWPCRIICCLFKIVLMDSQLSATVMLEAPVTEASLLRMGLAKIVMPIEEADVAMKAVVDEVDVEVVAAVLFVMTDIAKALPRTPYPVKKQNI